MSELVLIDAELWGRTRAGARSGRGFRYQDAVAAWLAVDAWTQQADWSVVVPEGVDDLTLHGADLEFRVQLKSRHDPQGRFTISEVAPHFAKTAKSLPSDWNKDPRCRVALVLERRVEGLEPTGWSVSLAQSSQSLKSLTSELESELEGWAAEDIQSLLARSHLIVEAQPMDRAVQGLAQATSLPDAATRLLAQRLRENVGAMADANYLAPSTTPQTVSVGDVQRAVDAFQSTVDPNSFLELTSGLCEAANFVEPIETAGFYSGVDVVPAHIGAGVVFDRPADVAEVLASLEGRRAALVSGPSGAGKSALAWLAAYHSRHTVRWYRVRACRSEDVPKLVHWARLLEVGPRRPVGFVVDNVGRDETTSGWDLLVREQTAVPGLLLVGTVREEDLFTLRTLPQTTVVRPLLDEVLAVRIWEALSLQGASVFSHWREPLELSHGLLLEYAHLLTAGARLEDTLTEQVDRRLAEERDDELLALRVITFATAHGALVDAERLRKRLNWETPRFARALKRLIDEHTVRQGNDAALSALHEIRSAYLDTAIQHALGDGRGIALVEAIHTVQADAFAGLVARTLRKWPAETETLLDAAAERLSDPDTPASAWIALLYGLALATADKIAERWLAITRARDIDDRFSAFAFTFVIAQSDFDNIPRFAPVKQAQADFAKVKVPDLRTGLLNRLGKDVSLPVLDLDAAHELVAAMLPLTGGEDTPKLNLGCDDAVEDPPLVPTLEFIQTLSEVDSQQAQKVVEACGGTELLLERLYQETPWLTRPVLGEADGEISVTAHVRHVSAPSQANINDCVVRACELMSIAAPQAKLMISDAIFPNGMPFGVGDYAAASKRLRRDTLPSPARIALNRVQNRAVGRLVAADNQTDRATALARAIADLARLLGDAADFYCRQEQPGPYWSGLKTVRGLMTQLIPPPQQSETFAGPLDQGTYKAHDSIHGFATNVQDLIGDLTNSETPRARLMALRARDLAKDAAKLTDPELWRMTGEQPAPALETLRQTLSDIAAIFADADVDASRPRTAALRFSKTSRKNNIVVRAAQEARTRTAADVETRCKAIARILETHDLNAEVFARPDDEHFGLNLLNARYLALSKASSIVEWLQGEPSITAACQELPDLTTLACAPLREGVVVPFGVQFALSLLPYGSLVADWQGRLPYPVLVDALLDDFRAASEAMYTASFILQERERPLLDEEDDHLGAQVDIVSKVTERVLKVVDEEDDGDVADVFQHLAATWNRVHDEFTEAPEGVSVAIETLDTTSELARMNLVAQVVLMERAIAKLTATTDTAASSNELG